MTSTDTAAQPVRLTGPRAVIAAMHEARTQRAAAEVREFRLAADFADHYRKPAGWRREDWASELHRPTYVRFGGDGTPEIDELCHLELVAALRLRDGQAQVLLRDALSLRHRFPRLWRALDEHLLRVWQARELVGLTGDLSHEDATYLDAEVESLLGSMTWNRLRELVKARVLAMLGEVAETQHQRRRRTRDVWFEESHLGITDMSARLDAADAVFLRAQVDRLAGILGHLPDQTDPGESLANRRARAPGVLASPALALQLLQAHHSDELDELAAELPGLDAGCPAAGLRGHTCGQITVDPDALLPRADLVVHLTDETLADGPTGRRFVLARAEDIGPLLAGWVSELLGHTRVRVRPVLNPDQIAPTDAYECPQRMREWVTLRNPYEVFPFSERRSRRLDLDHTRPWQRGPSGQTRPGNLGPLSRRVHRAKTHGGWTLTQPSPGTFRWRSPLGFGYLVTPSASWMVDDPTGRILTEPALTPP